ncbi:MAG: HAD-IA family hydrolase [Ferrovibrio sp.]|uniref:HAD-IA family hydrolase n=1 Tax=Ferrovibrio sp. TaxID=1917215 RepID=UPI0026372ACB|nr:HAD-IA family hydrolase [Ferrovibrio sp.]MCW0234521.1 HAD-IA family hydrolase [Ferrovibrio sp.]
MIRSVSVSGPGFEPPRLVIFDCDGTLVDSQHHIVSAMHSAFAANGLGLPEADSVRRTVGLPLEVAIERLLLPLGAGTLGAVVEAYKVAALAQRLEPDHEEPLFPGLVPVLDRLEADGFLLGVATGKARRGLNFTLNTHGLADRFVTLQTCDVVAVGKPAPDMVLQAMAETGAVPASTIVVGDTTYDMEMARNAGVAAIGVAWGYHDEDILLRTGAARIIKSFGELPDLVIELMARSSSAA